jgi:hypothetical protein
VSALAPEPEIEGVVRPEAIFPWTMTDLGAASVRVLDHHELIHAQKSLRMIGFEAAPLI